ncbi:hypothetical protein AB833_28375 [Chromatiales bacterium (ex Bugula neritina AB1)]|nr:hypothetical protein AB833_28375 [Chromatiales bacterium (ex Bugula neritina AB1)]
MTLFPLNLSITTSLTAKIAKVLTDTSDQIYYKSVARPGVALTPFNYILFACTGAMIFPSNSRPLTMLFCSYNAAIGLIQAKS